MRSPVLVVLLLCACGPQVKKPTWEADVKPLVQGTCAGCHVAGGIAPMPLTTYDEVAAVKDAVALAVADRRMPPYLAGPGCNEFADDQRLTDEQIAMLATWAKDPQRGTPTDAGPGAPVANTLPRVDATLSLAEPYTPTRSPDDYRCFVVDWPFAADTYVTGFHVTPGNARVVHHVIAFLIQPDKVAATQALDAADPGPGYTCFGGPGGDSTQVGWLGSWAPGSLASMYPAGTGLQVKAGSKVVLQVHYNTSAAPEGERTDQTKVELAVADTVDKRAWIMPWANPDWVRKHLMPIPQGQADVTHTFGMDPTQFNSYLTQGAVPSGQGFRMYAAGFHQHLLGKGGRLDIARADGTTECLLDVPRWDFHWQRTYPFARTKLFHPGDSLNITCHWDNSAAGQPTVNGVTQVPRDVNWGEGTGDEMCLGLFYISE